MGSVVEEGKASFSVEVQRDKRLRKSARWTMRDGQLLVRVPRFLSDAQVEELLDGLIPKVIRRRQHARSKNDQELDRCAQEINRKYFDGELRWHSIRWVSNMRKRLGSCSSGGATDGDIRIRDGIRRWPTFVVDYVIAHELAHRKYPNHSREFWQCLARYPHMERARGFIEGVAFAEQTDPDNWL